MLFGACGFLQNSHVISCWRKMNPLLLLAAGVLPFGETPRVPLVADAADQQVR